MKRTIGVLMLAIFLFVGFSSLTTVEGQGSGHKFQVEVAGSVKMSKEATVTINGKGFKPGQEVYILLMDKNGIETDIGYALKPTPKADDAGNWSTTWSCGRFISKKLVKEGENKLTVTDTEYTPLIDTTVSFYK